jgi:hypothetical protein
MTSIHSQQGRRLDGPNQSAGAAILSFGCIGLLIWFGTSVGAVFAASPVVGSLVIIVVAFVVALSVVVVHRRGWKSFPFALLALSAVWACLGGFIVFDNHWLAFTPAAWVFNVLYLAALASGAWSALNRWLKVAAAVFAVSLVAATVVLPRPPGGEGPFDTAKEWSIDIDVMDEHSEPIEGALVLCGSVMRWARELRLPETLARQSDREGRIPTWEFKEDPRLKVVLCNAWKNANDGNAGYPPATKFTVLVPGGREYQLHFTLVETPHPAIAYLTVVLNGDYYEQNWYYLDFELWAGEPEKHFGSDSGGKRPIRTTSWNELRGGGFAISAHEANQDLWLRYRYEGPSGEDLGPPYSEIRQIHVGAIEPGARKRLSLRIPNR